MGSRMFLDSVALKAPPNYTANKTLEEGYPVFGLPLKGTIPPSEADKMIGEIEMLTNELENQVSHNALLRVQKQQFEQGYNNMKNQLINQPLAKQIHASKGGEAGGDFGGEIAKVISYCSSQHVSTEPNDGKCHLNIGGSTYMDINLPEILSLSTQYDNDTPSSAPSSNEGSMNVRMDVKNMYNCVKLLQCIDSGIRHGL